jgi:RNA polymerase sigma factor (TIGR02999 family)
MTRRITTPGIPYSQVPIATDNTAETLDQIDGLLAAVRAGDMAARNQLIERIYPELRRLARGLMSGERTDHTLGATGSALVNLLWLRLLAPRSGDAPDAPKEDLAAVQNLQHLLGIAVRNMRNILVDYSRMSKAQKRPNRKDKVDVDQMSVLGIEMAALSPDALDIHVALQRLEPLQPESARAIELKYFAGLTNEEGAGAMGIPLIQFRRRCESGLNFMRNEFLSRRKGAGGH